MALLVHPDELTAQALKRLRGDTDFQRVVAWLGAALAARDAANRPLMDGVQLRMGQGAATAIAEIIGHAEGKPAVAGALSDTRSFLAGQGNRTP